MKELITKDKVDIVLGGLASSVGLAMSEVSKQEKVVYISTIPKIHPDHDGQAAQVCVPHLRRTPTRKATPWRCWPARTSSAKICHLELDYAYGNDLEAGILKALPKYAPNAKIVLTLKPKLGATDFNPFIPQVMASGCDGVLSGLWGPHFVSWVKQAKPLGFFDKIKWISGGEIGSHEIAGELKGDYPDNVISNTYELWYTGNDPSHKEFQARLAKKLNTPETPQWAALGYIGVMYAAAAMEKAQVDRCRQDCGGARGPDDRHAGRQAHHRRRRRHQANIGQFWGPMVKKPDRAYRMMEPAEYIQPK